MSQILTQEQQQKYFGQVYHGGGCYGCKYIQVAGFTPKKAIIRDVPTKDVTDRSKGPVDGGSATVDTDWLEANPAPYLASSKAGGSNYRLARIILPDPSDDHQYEIAIQDGGHFYMDYYTIVRDLNQVHTWCDY